MDLAQYSEIYDKLVIYRVLDGDTSPYARSLEKFLSLVDREKYLKQKYKFKEVIEFLNK